MEDILEPDRDGGSGFFHRKKPEIPVPTGSAGQTYFAIQTYRQEVADHFRYHFNEDAKETMQEKINRMPVTEASRMAMY